MSLTEKQKNLLRWIVKEVRADNLKEDSIWYYVTLAGYRWVDYKGSDICPDVEFATLGILEKYGYVEWEKKDPDQYKVALTQKAYEAVDSNFAEPDRSAIPHLIPLTEVEHLDSELWERVRFSVSAGGDNPKAWDTGIRNATVVLEDRMRKLGNIDNINQKATGNGIVNLIFGSNKSLQKDKLPSEELEAYRDLYSGTMKLFRNRYAHRFIDPKPEEGGAIILFIDLLLKMLDDLDWETENENT
ncbi:MAG: hypothetical protein EWV75_19905 [Microcystis wesenbergii Mw_QC_S_20081001_S30D]|jgi:hypothetical protein|uniref:Conserved hypothetical protein CHP02391 domain-containing protein n=1 Tax=Microcystis wesenbergii Mw_QC_S_20081001_S30D TaxID=2486245 RepID=A0A552JAC2_9CHRO|nr:hypothetical protein [Microcystis aeruginosa W11-03]NCR92900.1 hypothetical protein [Microcystis aeruginosa W11-06]TRU92728.1 MAG: hypothetical protein EWV75_19905 [Microcystis wesenbergii Mw_QC_S_20081001_S30D]TRV02117.1 MAG: hypothetical protein EWV73_07805 [Microcystis wesenbergii Mw_QC_B_20070930_S4D]TRV02343.1 MAG: hypothetical protein EWV74_09095 [Microcystis wesenbergii Mw_QC_S_20081001_S30]TRV17979.1 MAG: hypothetical protein EWV89_00895 [Microcystis wesenbergii Mw_QC_B_20070930_S4]